MTVALNATEPRAGLEAEAVNRFLVSVIIPALNEEEFLGQCFESLCCLDFPREAFEVLLVDNGSTDETVEIARSFSTRLNLVILQKTNAHISALRNLGAASAHGEIFAFLDADCVVPLNWLAQATTLVSTSDVGVVGAYYRIPDGSSWIAKAWYQNAAVEKRGRVSFVPAGNLQVRRSTFFRVGGFDESIQTNEDCEFCQRVRSAGLYVLGCPDIAVVHLGTPQTLVAFFLKHRWHGTHVLQVFLRDFPASSNTRAVLFAFYTLFCLVGLAAGGIRGAFSGRFDVLTVFLLVLLLPSFLQSLRLGILRKRLRDLFPLIILCLAYGIARATCLLEVNNWWGNWNSIAGAIPGLHRADGNATKPDVPT